jgi:hypothetical protein
MAVIAIMVALSAGCGGHSTVSVVHNRLLSASDLPAGWSPAPTSPNGVRLSNAPCLSILPGPPKGLTAAAGAFVQGESIPNLGEVLASGPPAQRTWRSLDPGLALCRTATIELGGRKVQSTVRRISSPRIGGTPSTYAWTFTLAAIKLGFDLVIFHAGRYDGYLAYADLGAPPAATVKAFARAAVTKAAKGSTARVADRVSNRLRAGADGAHQARRRRLPQHGKRTGAAADQRLWRNHGGVGSAPRRRPGTALPRGDLR